MRKMNDGNTADETWTSFNATATEARKFISSHAGIGDEFIGTLEQLNEAADAVKRLADFLERNPNALLVGRKVDGNSKR